MRASEREGFDAIRGRDESHDGFLALVLERCGTESIRQRQQVPRHLQQRRGRQTGVQEFQIVLEHLWVRLIDVHLMRTLE